MCVCVCVWRSSFGQWHHNCQETYLSRTRQVAVRLCNRKSCAGYFECVPALNMWCLWAMWLLWLCLLSCLVLFFRCHDQERTHTHPFSHATVVNTDAPIRWCAWESHSFVPLFMTDVCHVHSLIRRVCHHECFRIVSVHTLIHTPQRSLWRHNRQHMAFKFML